MKSVRIALSIPPQLEPQDEGGGATRQMPSGTRETEPGTDKERCVRAGGRAVR